MRFGYDSSILEVAPPLVAGVIWCRDIDNRTAIPAIEEMLAGAELRTREQFPEAADIARHPGIAAWREAYSKLGLTPNRYPCAAESLIRRVVTGGSIPNISPLVNLCNAVSLDHAIPVAPFDLHLAEGDVTVRLATGDEVFRPIGSDDLESIPAGEAVYADDTPEVLSRRWNWRQTGKGAIQPDSSDILITAEAVHLEGHQTVESVLAALATGIEQHFGATAQPSLLSLASPWSQRSTTPQEGPPHQLG